MSFSILSGEAGRLISGVDAAVIVQKEPCFFIKIESEASLNSKLVIESLYF